MAESRRAEKKAIVRRQLLHQARQLFTERGLSDTTVADIVDACTIARGTFYNYFPDVKAIFEEILDDININVRSVTAAARQQAASFHDLYYLSFKAYFDHVSQPELRDFHLRNRTYIRSISYDNRILREEVKAIRTDVQRMKGRGHFETDWEFELLSYMIVGAPTELFLNVMLQESELSSDEVATFLAKLFTKGAGLE